MKEIKSIFLPPRIQRRLWENPLNGEMLHDFAVAQIEALWRRRNVASDSEVDRIDEVMENIIRAEAATPASSHTSIYSSWTDGQVNAAIERKLDALKGKETTND